MMDIQYGGVILIIVYRSVKQETSKNQNTYLSQPNFLTSARSEKTNKQAPWQATTAEKSIGATRASTAETLMELPSGTLDPQ